MTPDLVSRLRNLSNHLRLAVGNPTHDKKGGCDGVTVQQLQYPVRLRLDA
jgi:hypothetical protein